MIDWNNRLDEITSEFKDKFGSLTLEQLNWKPDPGTWSIAQVIDHLIMINESYYPIFDRVIDGTYTAPFHARFSFLVNFLGKTILNSVDPKNRRKAKTFALWEPAKSDLPADIVDRFVSHQDKLKEYITRLSPAIASGTVINSPANRNIVYAISTAIEIIVMHEQRHLGQAEEILPLTAELGT